MWVSTGFATCFNIYFMHHDLTYIIFVFSSEIQIVFLSRNSKWLCSPISGVYISFNLVTYRAVTKIIIINIREVCFPIEWEILQRTNAKQMHEWWPRHSLRKFPAFISLLLTNYCYFGNEYFMSDAFKDRLFVRTPTFIKKLASRRLFVDLCIHCSDK